MMIIYWALLLLVGLRHVSRHVFEYAVQSLSSIQDVDLFRIHHLRFIES
jgi:hypothetical protein